MMYIVGKWRDYFVQVTDAGSDRGGLSTAPLPEAANWGKIEPDTVFC